MTTLLADRATVAAPPERVWAIFYDAAALRRVLPGCESLDATGEGTYSGVLASRLQFLTLRVQTTARLLDADPPRHVRLELSGRPHGLAGTFVVAIPIDLAPDRAGTVVSYQIDLQVTGRLAAFGVPLLRDTTRRQIAELIRNLEREVVTTREGSAG